LQEIAAELAAARTASASGSGNLARRWGKLPRVARRLGGWLLGRLPSTAARFGPPIGISSLGMFGPGWAIPISPMTLMVTVGGSSRRPVVRDGRLEEREVLPMTLSFDHSVIDGAPAARFAATFRQLLETGAALDTPAALGRRGNAHDDGNRNALGLPT